MPVSDTRRRPAPGKRVRRGLFLIHRWLGIASCLLFALWFVSGLVMVYVPYPSLTPAEKAAGAQPIDWRAFDRPPPVATMPASLQLEMRDGVPVWRIGTGDGTVRTVSASHRHARLAPVDASFAARAAARFTRTRPATGGERVERLERDQWTVAGGFDPHRPLWKVSMADRAGTELYVSSRTGAVVQATTRPERFWNWLGSVPHWLYPTVLRQNGPAWRQVVLWVSGPCIAAALTGFWIGILRTRLGRRRFGHGRVTPYQGWMLWHHAAGMTGGLFLLAWIFSGWLSVDPGHLFRGGKADADAMHRYAGRNRPMPPLAPEVLRRVAGTGARVVTLRFDAGLPRLSITYGDGHRQTIDLRTGGPARPAPVAIARAAGLLVPDGHVVRREWIARPDRYWYAIDGDPPLPVLRLRFDDPARTWLVADPETGAILERLDRGRRVYRWLFDLLHKWDLPQLTAHRPLRDLLLWLLSLLGLVTSVTGIRMGWKRLVRP